MCCPERGPDWRGVTYAVVLTARDGESGRPPWRRQQGLRRGKRGLEGEAAEAEAEDEEVLMVRPVRC